MFVCLHRIGGPNLAFYLAQLVSEYTSGGGGGGIQGVYLQSLKSPNSHFEVKEALNKKITKETPLSTV